VHLAAAAAHLQSFGVLWIDDRRAAACHAASLPDPGHHDDALAGEKLVEFLANLGLLPGGTLFVRAHQSRHQANIELGELPAPIGDWIETEIEYTFAYRGKLRHGLHQRRIGVDLRGERAIRPLLELGREFAT